MDGPSHYRESEQLLDRASDRARERALMFAEAQVHATLALAATTIDSVVRVYGFAQDPTGGDEDLAHTRKWVDAVTS